MLRNVRPYSLRRPNAFLLSLGSIVLAYSPEGLPPHLKLSRAVYADIFLGKITHWDDPRITAINPSVNFPDRDIQVVARHDGSGTTFAFTNHLSAISEEWRKGPGVHMSASWPRTSVANGNEGVAGSIARGTGMIGYVHYGTAQRAGLGMAWLENKAGNYIKPTGTSGLQTLLQSKLPPDLRMFMPDPDGKDSYPIITYSWLLLHKTYNDPKELEALKELVRWCLDEGQEYQRIAWLSPSSSPCRRRRHPCVGVDFRKVAIRGQSQEHPHPLHAEFRPQPDGRRHPAELCGRPIPHLQCRFGSRPYPSDGRAGNGGDRHRHFWATFQECAGISRQDYRPLLRVSEIIDGPAVAIIDGMGGRRAVQVPVASSLFGRHAVLLSSAGMWVVPFPLISICGTGTAASATDCAACELMQQAGAGRGGR